MGARLATGHLLFKWFFFCLILIIIFMLYAPYKNIEIEPTMRSKTEVVSAIPTPNLAKSLPKIEVPKHFVHTSQCMIPYINPFSAEALKIYTPRKFIPCSNDSELVSALYDVNRQRYVLHINEPVAKKLLNSSEREFNCFYREIQHGEKAETYDM